ncbi:MAG: hypothetical protein IPM97_08460 [Bdellovibrionaceae bacterium]|nr:hypothetical protein [Pseudobdellovibrionaceae bacterium]
MFGTLHLIVIFVGFLPLISNAATIKFETSEDVDKQFIEKNELWINDQYLKLETYFGIETKNPITVQVLPVSKNPDFKSCARIYGTKRIYVHSPSSLKALIPDQRKKYDSFCFERDYEDLKYTLVHEYVHVLTLIRKMDSNPKWLWEGAAVALSGQLKHTQMGQNLKFSLSNIHSINICETAISDKDAYLLGGALLSFYESKSSGFIRDLISSLAKYPSQNVQQFIQARKLNCEVSSQDIVAAI